MGGLKGEWSYDDLNNLINYAMGSIPRKKMSFFGLKIKVVVPLCSMTSIRFQRVLLHCPNHSLDGSTERRGYSSDLRR